MLTPMDIQNKDFKRATIRGYREDEVEEFLDRVAADYERLYRENEKLKERRLRCLFLDRYGINYYNK